MGLGFRNVFWILRGKFISIVIKNKYKQKITIYIFISNTYFVKHHDIKRNNISSEKLRVECLDIVFNINDTKI